MEKKNRQASRLGCRGLCRIHVLWFRLATLDFAIERRRLAEGRFRFVAFPASYNQIQYMMLFLLIKRQYLYDRFYFALYKCAVSFFFLALIFMQGQVEDDFMACHSEPNDKKRLKYVLNDICFQNFYRAHKFSK